MRMLYELEKAPAIVVWNIDGGNLRRFSLHQRLIREGMDLDDPYWRLS